jgi:glucosamine kinase
MNLLIDSGATKTEFLVVQQGTPFFRFYNSGINVNYADDDYIIKQINQFKFEFEKHHQSIFNRIRYYGAGCFNPSNGKRVSTILQALFPNSHIEVFSDLLAVCHALYSNGSGYAGILGTGAAGCFYNGSEITQIAPSLGYLLGDEGSGSFIGKLFLQKYLKGILDTDLCLTFENEFQVTKNVVIHKLYREGNPQTFMSSIAPFIHKNEDHDEIKCLIIENFNQFFDYQLNYINDRTIIWKFSGSIAYHFAPFLHQSADKFGIIISKIIKSPLFELIEQF